MDDIKDSTAAKVIRGHARSPFGKDVLSEISRFVACFANGATIEGKCVMDNSVVNRSRVVDNHDTQSY